MYLPYVVIAITAALGLGTVISTTTKSNVEAQLLLKSKELGSQAAFVALTQAYDFDNDLEPEVPGYLDSTTLAEREDGVPFDKSFISVAAPAVDSFGQVFRYCAWNNGPVVESPQVDLDLNEHHFLTGQAGDEMVQYAVISAGPDGVFSTKCSNIFENKSTLGDDFAVFKTTGEVKQGVLDGVSIDGGSESNRPLVFYDVPPTARANVARGVTEFKPSGLAPTTFKESVYTNAGGSYQFAVVGGSIEGSLHTGLLVAGFNASTNSWGIYGLGSNIYGQLGLGETGFTSTPQEALLLPADPQREPRLYSLSTPIGVVNYGTDVYVSSAWSEEVSIDAEPSQKFASYLGLGDVSSVLSTTGRSPKTFVRYGEPGTLNGQGNYSFNGLTAPLDAIYFGGHFLGATNNNKPTSLALDSSKTAWSIKGGVRSVASAANLALKQYEVDPTFSVFSRYTSNYLLDESGSLTNAGANSQFILPAENARQLAAFRAYQFEERNAFFGSGQVSSGPTSERNDSFIGVGVDSIESSITIFGSSYLLNTDTRKVYNLKVPSGVRNAAICPAFKDGVYVKNSLTGSNTFGITSDPSSAFTNPLDLSRNQAARSTQGYHLWVASKDGQLYLSSRPGIPGRDEGFGLSNSEIGQASSALLNVRDVHLITCGASDNKATSGAYFVDGQGRLFAFGGTAFGLYPLPTLIEVPNGLKVIGIQSNPNNVYVLLEDGSLWGAGKNDYGQLGRPVSTAYTALVPIFENLFSNPTFVGTP